MLFFISLFLGTAEAKKGMIKPYMYGWGPSVNTMMVPFQYPYAFPSGQNGAEPPNEQLEEMRQDIGFGPKFIMYPNRMYRVAAYPHLHFGANESGYKSIGMSIEGDRSAMVDKNIVAYYGLGVGSNLFAFDQGQDGRVSGQQHYLKGQIGGIYFDRTRAYELSLYAKLGFTGVEVFEYGGVDHEINITEYSPSLYTPTLGLQGTYYIGDFRKITEKKKKKKPRKK